MAFDLDIYLNTATGEPQISDISQARFILPTFYQGDKVPIRIHLLKPDPTGDFNAFERPPIDNLTLKFAVSAQPIGTAGTPTPFVTQFSWNKDTDADIFDAIVDFNTTELNTFLGSEYQKEAHLEIEVTDANSGGIWTVLQKTVTVQAQVIEPASSAVAGGETPLSLEMANGLFVKYQLPPGRTITFRDTAEAWDVTIGAGPSGQLKTQKIPV